MRDAKYRAASAEAEVIKIADEAKAGIKQMTSTVVSLEAALRVLMNHNLLGEFSEQLKKLTMTNGERA